MSAFAALFCDAVSADCAEETPDCAVALSAAVGVEFVAGGLRRRDLRLRGADALFRGGDIGCRSAVEEILVVILSLYDGGLRLGERLICGGDLCRSRAIEEVSRA